MDIVLLVAGVVVVVVFAALWMRQTAATGAAPLDDDDSLGSRAGHPAQRATTVFDNRPLVTMRYADRDGVVTERTVAVLNMDIDTDAMRVTRFRAWCGLRGGQREFRVDRVLDMRDEQTGAIVTDPGRHLARYAPSGGLGGR